MKINKKLVVTSLSTILGLGIVGSVTGTIAWYQFSNRARTSIIGTSTGISGLLEIRKHSDGDDPYKTSLITEDVDERADTYKGKFEPVTFGQMTATGALPAQAYRNPTAGVADMTKWAKATVNQEYLQYKVDLRAQKMNQSTGKVETPVEDGKIVYLTDMVIEDADTDAVSKAVRVHITDGTNTYLISKNGGSLDTHGKLDLDKDPGADKGTTDGSQIYEWTNPANIVELDYGDGASAKQESTAYSDLVAELQDDGTYSKDPMFTLASGKATLTITIWLEGWEQFDDNADFKPVWNGENRNNKTFHVGMTFEVDATKFR